MAYGTRSPSSPGYENGSSMDAHWWWGYAIGALVGYIAGRIGEKNIQKRRRGRAARRTDA